MAVCGRMIRSLEFAKGRGVVSCGPSLFGVRKRLRPRKARTRRLGSLEGLHRFSSLAVEKPRAALGSEPWSLIGHRPIILRCRKIMGLDSALILFLSYSYKPSRW